MVVRETTLGRLGQAKEIKVKIPLDYHIKLHTLKVLKGQSISDTVEAALYSYFEEFAREDGQAHEQITEHLQSIRI